MGLKNNNLRGNTIIKNISLHYNAAPDLITNKKQEKQYQENKTMQCILKAI